MSQPLRIGEWEFAADRHLLTNAGKSVRLERKQAEVLELLARRPGEVFTRDELLNSVWSDVHVTEEVLTNAVYELRRVLRDDSRRPRYIETIPRRGYRLVADVQAATPARSQSLRNTRAAMPLVAGVVATVLLLLAAAGAVSSSLRGDRSEASSIAGQADLELDGATRQGSIRALELYDQSLRLHPENSAALAGRAIARLALTSAGDLSPELSYGQAERDARAAIRLDPRKPEGHIALGSLRMAQWKWDEAELHLRRAVETGPRSAHAKATLAEFLLLSGDSSGALSMVEDARRLAPDSARVLSSAGFIHSMLRDDRAAVADYKRILLRNPEHAGARRQLEKLSSREPAPATDRDTLLSSVDALLKKGNVRPAIIAGMFAEAGETERALEWLERARREKDLSLLLVRLDDRWHRLHSDARLRTILDSVGPR